MQRRLIVMRHAKSSWSSPARSDHERPLNKRGQRDAPRVGAALVERGWIPELVLSSDSERTRETFARMSESFPAQVPVRFLRSLYLAGASAVREELAGVDAGVGCVLALGHNPGWEQVVEWLTGEAVVMKTATAALLTNDDGSWREACETGGRWAISEVIYPREL